MAYIIRFKNNNDSLVKFLLDVNILSQSAASMMILSGIMNLVVKLVSKLKTSALMSYELL